jgi:hypothetical protein
MSWKAAVGNSAEPVVRKSGGATGRQFNVVAIQGRRFKVAIQVVAI